MKNNEQLNQLIAEYCEIRSLAAEAKRQQDELSGQIKALMEKEGLETYNAPAANAIYREVVSHPVDTAMLKRELPELAERYTVERITRPLKIA